MSDEQRRPPSKGPRPASKGPKPPNKGAKPTKKKAPAARGGERRPAVSAPDPTAARGIVLVVLAVIIGFFLLAKGLDAENAIIDADTGDVVKEEETQETAPGQTVPEGTGPSDSVLTPTTRPAAEVAVLVGNGSGVSGAAGTVSEQLQPFGYKIVEASNAAQTPTTIIYYGEGYQVDAEAVAGHLGVDLANVKPMPLPAPPVDRIAEANVFVQLGPDKAPAA